VSKRELEITTTPTAAKVCMNLTPLKQLFVTYLAVVYKPLVTTLLPDSMQLLLLDEATFSFLGFNLISALVVGQFVLLALGLCIQVSKRASDGRAKRIYHLNQQLVALLSRVQVLEYEKGTLAALVAETEKSNKNSSGPGNNSRPASTSSRKKSDSINQQQSQQQQHNQQQQDNGHVFRLERELMQVRQAHEHAMTEVARNRASLDAMAAELRSVTSQYGQLDEEKRDMEYQVATLTEAVKEWEQRCAHGEQKLGYYENLFREQQAHAEKLNAELEQRENTVTMLKNSLLLRVNNQKQSQVTAAAANTSTDTDSDDLEVINRDELTAGDGHGQLEASPPVTMDTVMHVAQLEMSVKTLRDKYAASEADRAQKTSECLSLVQQLSERSEAVYGLEAKVKRLERQQKEGEIQIRLLGELREKDAKQHLRSLADIDTQLKKKTTESEKVSHLLEQLRAKQERIHEMETLVSRTERQANQERQTFEKQAHESWLASKKIDKQLRDAQAELVVLQNRYVDFSLSSVFIRESRA
jgi:chromosome segregation ATPase